MTREIPLSVSIHETHYLDVDEARRLLRQAIDQAEAKWISPRAIGDALLEEMALLDRTRLNRQMVAAHLRRIADRLDAEPANHIEI